MTPIRKVIVTAGLLIGLAVTLCVSGALSLTASAAVQPGEVFVADPDAGPGTTGAILRIDQSSGAQAVVSSGGQLESPTGLAIGAEGELLVIDPDALGGPGALFLVNPDTGDQQVLSNGGSFEEPTGVADAGEPVIADRDSDPPNPDVFGDGNVISIDPATGEQTSVLSPPALGNQRPLADPTGVWPSPQGRWFVADPNAGDGSSGALFEQYPSTKNFPYPGLSVTSAGGELVDVTGGTIATDPGLPEYGISERPVVVDPNAAGGSGAVINVNPSTGDQTIVSSGGAFSDPYGIAYSPGPPSRLLVADPSASGGTGAVFVVDSATGAQQVLSSGGSFVEPTGIAVVPPLCLGDYATLSGSPGADRLRLGYTAGVIAALDGDDFVEGSDYPTVICGDAGDDELVGDGFQTVTYLASDDVLSGGEGNDKLEGDGGEDTLTGDAGKDRLGGEGGNDTLKGGPGKDALRGGGGKDVLVGGAGKDRCTGGPGRDRLKGC